MASKSIVRDIHVTVPRVAESCGAADPTAYVFAVRARPSLLSSTSSSSSQRMRRRLSMTEQTTLSIEWRDPVTSRRYSESSAFMPVELAPSAPFVHEVARTYTQCRMLFRRLSAYTDCRSMETCGCILGSCPFWSMHAVLKSFPFPRRSLLSFQWSHKALTTQRMLAFNQLMASILHHFQLYRDDFFIDRVSSTEFHGCKVIATLESFLGLTEDVVEQFRQDEARQQLKMNLRGWQSDRKNLYFGEEGDGEDVITTTSRKTRRETSDSVADTQIDSMGVDVDEIIRSLLNDEMPTDKQ